VAADLLGTVGKVVVARVRPALPDPVSFASGLAFPSGHALDSVVGVGVLTILLLPVLNGQARVAAWVIGTAVAVSVAFTRIALGVHWLSDVLAGLMLGVAVVAATASALDPWRRSVSAPAQESGSGETAGVLPP
jgi:undecaprenyl-diphosphatase